MEKETSYLEEFALDSQHKNILKTVYSVLLLYTTTIGSIDQTSSKYWLNGRKGTKGFIDGRMYYL